MCVRVEEREREREKALSGSCAVWMMRPMSAACQDVASYVRYPSSYECDFVCVCVCVRVEEREKALCCLDDASNVSSLSKCCVLCQVPQ